MSNIYGMSLLAPFGGAEIARGKITRLQRRFLLALSPPLRGAGAITGVRPVPRRGTCALKGQSPCPLRTLRVGFARGATLPERGGPRGAQEPTEVGGSFLKSHNRSPRKGMVFDVSLGAHKIRHSMAGCFFDARRFGLP
jgi:hypothetical protein